LERGTGQAVVAHATTSEAAGAGRVGGLDVNPEAKLKAVLEISNSLAGTLDLAALLPKIAGTPGTTRRATTLPS